MKTYIYKIFVSLCAILIVVACDSEWVNPEATFDKGGLVKAVVDPSKTTIDFFGDLNSATVEFDLVPTDANGQGSGELIQSMEMYFEYFSATTQTTTAEQSIAVVTDFSQKQVFTVPELAALGGVTIADLFGGDSFVFSFDVTMKDGRVFTHDEIENTICGAVNSRGTCTLTVPIICPSDLMGATVVVYDLSTNISSTCCGRTLGLQQAGRTSTATNLGGGNYQFDDVLAGHLAGFSIDPEPIIVNDLCTTLSLVRDGGSVLDYTTGVHDAPTYDAGTGVWTISFNNASNGIAGVATLTPQ